MSAVPHQTIPFQPRAQGVLARARQRAGDSDGVHTDRLSDAVLMISDTSASSFVFELRSRVNARVLVGGPIEYSGDVQAKAASLLERCKNEASFRIDHKPGGNVLKLFDENGQELGTSEQIAGEAMTLAMLKLIATQARVARIVHCD